MLNRMGQKMTSSGLDLMEKTGVNKGTTVKWRRNERTVTLEQQQLQQNTQSKAKTTKASVANRIKSAIEEEIPGLERSDLMDSYKASHGNDSGIDMKAFKRKLKEAIASRVISEDLQNYDEKVTTVDNANKTGGGLKNRQFDSFGKSFSDAFGEKQDNSHKKRFKEEPNLLLPKHLQNKARGAAKNRMAAGADEGFIFITGGGSNKTKEEPTMFTTALTNVMKVQTPSGDRVEKQLDNEQDYGNIDDVKVNSTSSQLWNYKTTENEETTAEKREKSTLKVSSLELSKERLKTTQSLDDDSKKKTTKTKKAAEESHEKSNTLKQSGEEKKVTKSGKNESEEREKMVTWKSDEQSGEVQKKATNLGWKESSEVTKSGERVETTTKSRNFTHTTKWKMNTKNDETRKWTEVSNSREFKVKRFSSPKTKTTESSPISSGQRSTRVAEKKLMMTFQVGQYPYEDPSVVEEIKEFVTKMEKTNKTLLKDSIFPVVDECSLCSDFDVCLVFEEDKKQQCFRRTLAREPCPELCDEDQRIEFKSKKKLWLDKKKKKLDQLAKRGLIEGVDSCGNCSKSEICVPAKSKGLFLCVPNRLLSDFDDPCKLLCAEKERCRISGNECIPGKKAGKSVELDVSGYKHPKNRKSESDNSYIGEIFESRVKTTMMVVPTTKKTIPKFQSEEEDDDDDAGFHGSTTEKVKKKLNYSKLRLITFSGTHLQNDAIYFGKCNKPVKRSLL